MQYTKITKITDISDVEIIDIIDPDGVTYWTAEEAAEKACAESRLLVDPLNGRIDWRNLELLEEHYHWTIWEDGQVCWAIWAQKDLIAYIKGRLWVSGVFEEGLSAQAYVASFEELYDYISSQEDIYEALRDESGIVYKPYGVIARWENGGVPDNGDYYWPLGEAERFLKAWWKHHHRRAPRRYDLLGHNFWIKAEVLEAAAYSIERCCLKAWLRHAKKLPKEATIHERFALLHASAQWSGASMDQLSKYGDCWNDIWETYGGVSDERVRLLKKSRKQEFISALRMIPQEVDLSKAKVAEILRMGSRFVYQGVTDDFVAHACYEVGMSQYEFESFMKYWEERRKKEYESIPSCGVVEKGGYKMYRLESDDPRGPLLGRYTNCCQHPGGMGETCAKHGMESPDGAFFAIEKMGKIIAQSWAWRNKDTICFDNIEALSGDYMKIVADLYQETANRLVGRLGITQVVVGERYDKLGVKNYWPRCKRPAPLPDCYSDAAVQYLIAKEEG